jgi:membrane protease YdiL (CAAX protease family)
MLIVGMIFVIIKGVQKDFSLLLTINTVELKASLVEEFVFRSLMLGMMLKIDKIEFRKDHITFLNLKTPYIWNSKQSNKLIRVVVLSSIYFSLFHIWDLTFLPPLGKLINFTSRIILGIIYGGFYVLSGKKIYPSFFLHYINNLYA